MAKRPRHGVERETKIEVESIAHVRLVVNSNWEAENLEIGQ